MVNEKEFRKYIRRTYHERQANRLYLAVLILLLVVVSVFVFVSTETSVGTIEDTLVIQSREDAVNTANDITRELQVTGSLLMDLESIESDLG